MRKSTLKRKTPLARDQTHDWEWEITGGVKHQICSKCNSLWVAGEPPKEGCSGLKKSKIKPSNPERRERMRTDEDGYTHTYGPYHVWISTMPCLVENRRADDVDGHHLKGVHAGGRDFRNEIPLRRRYHIELHTIGEDRFCEKYGLHPLEVVAERFGDVWERRQGGWRYVTADAKLDEAIRQRQGAAGD